jgi:hypothetical protein
MTRQTELIFPRIRSSLISGAIKGWRGLIWLLKMIIPISFATALLVHFGLIYRLDFLLTPAMNLVGLPSEAALPIIIGLFTGIYGAVAAMAVIPLSVEHMTLIAIFLLISHNLIQESIVQGQSGIHPVFAGCFRLIMSFVVTFFCAKMIGAGQPLNMAVENAAGIGPASVSFIAMLSGWTVSILKLCLKIFLIIMPLMMIMEMARVFSWIQFITRFLAPVIRIMGLSRNTGMLWLTASFFGLAYGAAVIVEETRTHAYSKDELRKLHLSVGINHAMIEDPALFIPLGLPAFWLYVPRIVAAVLAVYIFSAFIFARRLYVKRACHKKLCDH